MRELKMEKESKRAKGGERERKGARMRQKGGKRERGKRGKREREKGGKKEKERERYHVSSLQVTVAMSSQFLTQDSHPGDALLYNFTLIAVEPRVLNFSTPFLFRGSSDLLLFCAFRYYARYTLESLSLSFSPPPSPSHLFDHFNIQPS